MSNLLQLQDSSKCNDKRNKINVGIAEAPPRIVNHVMIGADAVILGNITIGDNAVIGADAVVPHDVPSYYLAVGVPALVKKIEE